MRWNTDTNHRSALNHTIPSIPYYTILYHTIPYYTILYHTIPYYTILYHTTPYYTILYHTIPYYTILYHTIPYFTILYHTTAYYTILYYTLPYYTTLYHTIPYYSPTEISWPGPWRGRAVRYIHSPTTQLSWLPKSLDYINWLWYFFGFLLFQGNRSGSRLLQRRPLIQSPNMAKTEDSCTKLYKMNRVRGLTSLLPLSRESEQVGEMAGWRDGLPSTNTWGQIRLLICFQLLSVRGWTSALFCDFHRLCGVIEGRLSHFLPRGLRTGWQRVISQGWHRTGWQRVISWGKIPWNTPPQSEIKPGPPGGQTVRFILPLSYHDCPFQ